MIRIGTLATLLCLAALPATSQSMLPRCSAMLDGLVSVGGCSCGYDPGGQLSARPPGWRWSCNLLHGTGMAEAPPPAGAEPQGLPPGFVYAPQTSPSATASASPSTMGLGRSMRY